MPPPSPSIFTARFCKPTCSPETATHGASAVYGVKKQERAFLAAITEGAEYAQIGVSPSVNMSTIKLNRCSFQFIYREQYRIYLSNIVKYGDNLSSTLYGTRMTPDRLDLDREIRFSSSRMTRPITAAWRTFTVPTCFTADR